VVDEHAITIRNDPETLRRSIYRAFACLLAAGLSPEKSTLFVQSHVPAHAELSWILSCYTMFGEMSRMTQFKDKSQKNADNINTGLFTYPVLMAADILLYQAKYVPVGVDQKQHVEIARDIAGRYNAVYGNTFTLPEAYIPAVGAKIMSLAEPQKKMSKSDSNLSATVFVLDSQDDIIRKFKRAVTDSGSEVRRGDGKDGVNNLIGIYAAVTGASPEAVEDMFVGKGYGAFKMACGEAVAEMLRPFREKVEDLLNNEDYLRTLFRQGAEKAAAAANKTLHRAQNDVGFIPLE
jgi:tryptophanyl-tRNA synthetase